MVLPLEGIRVVELGVWVLVPICARVLGELGAEVIKVENPRGGDPVHGLLFPEEIPTPGVTYLNATWEQCNAGKRDIAVDLAQEAGREIVYKLVERADVFLTNLRASVVDKLAVDYETVAKINPRIIYAQATGFGPKGPDRSRAAFDETAFWIRSGLMSTLGEPDAPPVPLRGAMGDLSTALFLNGAIVTALLARERFGFGQKIDISLMSSGMWVNGIDIQRRLIRGEREIIRKETRKSPPNPLRDSYQTKDKKWFFFMMVDTDRFWPPLCKAIEREDLEKDPRFDSHVKRLESSALIVSILDEVFSSRTMAEWAGRFEQYSLVWEPETTVPEVLADPQVSENKYIAQAKYSSGKLEELLCVPFQFSRTPTRSRSGAPELGQHTEEILLEMGYERDQISQLREQNVVI